MISGSSKKAQSSSRQEGKSPTGLSSTAVVTPRDNRDKGPSLSRTERHPRCKREPSSRPPTPGKPHHKGGSCRVVLQNRWSNSGVLPIDKAGSDTHRIPPKFLSPWRHSSNPPCTSSSTRKPLQKSAVRAP